MTRAQWKLLHRKQRIVRREYIKMMRDAMIFGRGMIYLSAGGIKHVPHDERADSWASILHSQS